MAPDGVDSGVTPTDRVTPVPIGDYGFLSDGEVSALLAPDGAVDWMCVPAVRLPQCLRLDPRGRRAGDFRLAPLDVGVPAQRRYLPGTMILETSWGTADRLDHRARRAVDRAVAPRPGPLGRRTTGRPPTTRPSTSCCAPSAASRARCRPSWTVSRCSTTAAGPSTGSTPATTITRARRRPRTPTSDSPSPPTCSSASRAGRPPPAPCSRRATSASSPCRGVAPSHR